ncbi:unnamed protein product [Closterium sp. NIES-53]
MESLIESREPASQASTPIRTCRAARPCPPPVPGTQTMAVRPSSVAQHVALPSRPVSSLIDVPDPESDLGHAANTSMPPFYVLVYVGNLVFATNDTKALALVKAELQKRHTYTDLGELRSYLGLQITQDRARRTITLTQSHMVHQVLQRFGFRFFSPQPTPLPTCHLLLAPSLDESVEPSGLYPELVGCLMNLMTCARPDLAYPLSLLACYVAPDRRQKEHWIGAQRVLCYVCCT